jgi:sugar lactone lactonase YvrE
MTLALDADGAPEDGAEPEPFLNKDSVPGSRFSIPDGINVDDDGNVYVALNDWNVNAVAVFSPDGEYIGEYSVPVGLDDGKTADNGPGNGPSNISFGGDDRTTMFITTHHSIWMVEVETPGLP